ncbi:MAG: ATP-binding cassette domain-containing protein [Demequinaceae bacterium]|nr:ATP-binding cassette domain-containing protein [Demequinaceae bacterium]
MTRRYDDVVVLDKFTLELDEDRVTAITGPNGSGKTTIARLILGIDPPDGGTVEGLDGRRHAAVFQENRLCDHLTAVNNVRLVLDHPDRAYVEDQLRRAGLPDEALERPVRTLSGGQRRRVAIVRALAGDADLVVLDEPFSGIDADSKADLVDYVRERLRGRTALLITHDSREAKRFGARVVKLAARRSR